MYLNLYSTTCCTASKTQKYHKCQLKFIYSQLEIGLPFLVYLALLHAACVAPRCQCHQKGKTTQAALCIAHGHKENT